MDKQWVSDSDNSDVDYKVLITQKRVGDIRNHNLECFITFFVTLSYNYSSAQLLDH